MGNIANTQDRHTNRATDNADAIAKHSSAVERIESRKLCESSRMPFNGAEPEAELRLAALLPSGKVTCKISQRAYRRLINFERRGGPEPEWYMYRDWNAELGHEVPRLRTPEEIVDDQAEAAAYEKRWEASITARYTLILHTICEAVEATLGKAADKAWHMAGGFPDGYIRFSVPEDMAPQKPLVELAVCCELNPSDAPSVCLVVACLDEAIATGVPCASGN